MTFRPARINRLLGIDLSGERQRELLRRVEVGTEAAPPGSRVTVVAGGLSVPVTDGEDAWVAIVPGHRRDLAIEAMNEHRTGCVLVAEHDRLVGVFTERDVLTKVAAQGLSIDETAVEEVMTRDPEWLTLDDGIAYALNMMSVGGFRHIPLVDDELRPAGVVAMRDIVDFIVDLFPEEVLNLPPSPAHGIAREREGA